MRVLLSIILFIYFSFCVKAQNVFDAADTLNFEYSGWTNEEKLQAITTNNADYLSVIEKEVIILANLSRINPKLFSKTFLLQYITSNQLTSNSYVRSLQRTLKRMKALAAFVPDEKLFELAKTHAIWSGEKGRVGHQNFSHRSNSSGYNYFAENCQYGYNTAIEIFLDLLIDEGIPDYGHRNNFMSKDTKFIGVSIQSHKKYDYNCVIDFGGN